MLPRVKISVFWQLLLLSTLVSILGGCSSPPKVSLDDPETDQKNVGLIYGYIDMDKALSSVYDRIVARQYRPATKDYELHVYRSGLFYHLGVDPGSHQIVRLGTKTLVRYFGVHQKNQTAIKVKEPGLYYMGSYLYELPEPGKFNMKKAKSPSEKEVLKLLLKVMEDEHSEYKMQIGWIKQRIKQL